MSTMRGILCISSIGIFGILLMFSGTGCGLLTEKDSIKIAKVNDHYFTRGELKELIRNMPDDERPHIRNRGDLIRVMKTHIDEQLKQALGRQLQEEGKVKISRDTAKEQYFDKHKEENFRGMYQIENPDAFGMSAAELKMMKEEIETGIDKEMANMLGEAAISYRTEEGMKAKTLAVSEEELKREYELQKDTMKKFEWMKFMAFRFVTAMPNAEMQAAAIRKRLNSGTPFDELAKEYSEMNPNFVIESEIENNPNLDRFRGFWVNASGAQTGDIIGPIFMPAYQLMTTNAQGKSGSVQMPEAYMVLQVKDHRPETVMSYDEARLYLSIPLLVSKAMESLRQENGVEIYEDKFPDPEPFEESSGDPIQGSM